MGVHLRGRKKKSKTRHHMLNYMKNQEKRIDKDMKMEK